MAYTWKTQILHNGDTMLSVNFSAITILSVHKLDIERAQNYREDRDHREEVFYIVFIKAIRSFQHCAIRKNLCRIAKRALFDRTRVH